MGWSVRLFVLLCLSGLSVIAESPKGNDDGLLCLSFLFSCRCLFQPFPEGMCIEGVYPIGQGDDDVPMVDVHGTAARHADILLCDTAGRLHNKKNLMEELKKINRIIDKEFPDAHRENLVVLDGTTGQNALNQAREFGETADLTGIILTKMDGTAKGGIAVAIQSELNIPVKYIGVGETIEDLQKFDAQQFVNALFEVEETPGGNEDGE